MGFNLLWIYPGRAVIVVVTSSHSKKDLKVLFLQWLVVTWGQAFARKSQDREEGLSSLLLTFQRQL